MPQTHTDMIRSRIITIMKSELQFLNVETEVLNISIEKLRWSVSQGLIKDDSDDILPIEHKHSTEKSFPLTN